MNVLIVFTAYSNSIKFVKNIVFCREQHVFLPYINRMRDSSKKPLGLLNDIILIHPGLISQHLQLLSLCVSDPEDSPPPLVTWLADVQLKEASPISRSRLTHC